ncbi:DUF885 domain-containing protein [Massilia sp. W12]|uniref:DUF885 domain-containing protein n=1 Tax=Massilia sp. W12 TaxID=3126507 RepID=UPI0030D526C1
MKRHLLALALSLTFSPLPALAQPAAIAPALAPAVSAAQTLQQLGDAYYEALVRWDPVMATQFGDNRHDHLLPSLAPAARERWFKDLRAMQAQLQTIPLRDLSAEDKLTHTLLQHELQSALALAPFPEHLMPLVQMDAMPVTIAGFGSGDASQPLKTLAHYEAYLQRVRGLSGWIAQAMANMREGMRRNVVSHQALITSLLPQIETLAKATLDNSDFSAPLRRFPADFSDADKTRLRSAYQTEIRQNLLPALRRLHTFLRDEYLPKARRQAGWHSLPQGRAWYAALVKNQTNTDLDYAQIHQLGLQEVARIQGELRKLGAKLGYSGEPAGLFVYLDQQAGSKPFKTEQEVLAGYQAILQKVEPELTKLFLSRPKAGLQIQAEPELSRATASDHYTGPADDGSRPGIFWAVINDPAEYRVLGMHSLFLHEGLPGHHFQIARQAEMQAPRFRKFGGSNAYIEGWALYAETLGHEMGLYADPVAYAGHLRMDLVRAVRLVVDTGLHGKGWSREQTIDYLMKTQGSSASGAARSTERYMAWPGQALSYKMGALKIMELRRQAGQKLGARFSLAQFHEVVLRDGALPLNVLQQQVDAWMQSELQRAAN